MDTFLFLLSDGIANGAIYMLVAVSLVLIHTVTRVVNIGQGEFVMLGAMTLASFVDRAVPPTLGLLLGGGLLCALFEMWAARRAPKRILKLGAGFIVTAMVVAAMVWLTLWSRSYLAAIACSLLLVGLLGPVVYRLTVQPGLESNAIVLVVVSVGVQMALHGLALILWGAEPRSVPAFSDAAFTLGPVFLSGQTLWILGVSGSVMVALYAFFEFTLLGKALRATAMNRRGAQLCGISVRGAGLSSYGLAACFSGASGMMLAPLVTANVDMGFLIGLKGFVGATFSGLAAYPMSVAGVALVGVLDSFSAYGLSSYRDAIVFAMILPILLWRNGFRHGRSDR